MCILGAGQILLHVHTNFSASPLSSLTRKGEPAKVQWTSKSEQVFHALKKALTTVLFSESQTLTIHHPDASETCLGAMLSQVIEDEEHPMLCINHKLSPAENYMAVETEALAIKWVIMELV